MERARASGEFCLWRCRRFTIICSAVLFRLLSLLSLVTFGSGLVLTMGIVMWLGIMLMLEPYSGYEIEYDNLLWLC